MLWFTANPHYSHGKVIRFCDRPFPDTDAMNAYLLAECRASVGPDDDLLILGDLTAGKATSAQRDEVQHIFLALPGRKHLIWGNYDPDWVCALPWDSVAETADIVVDKRRLVLCHYPMITWPGARHWGLQLFGHVHNNWWGRRNSVNVGVDVWNFRPVNLGEIEARAAGLPANAHWDQVEPGRANPTVLCASCGRILDPALVAGHAVVRNGQIVVADANETIVVMNDALCKRLPEGRHVCPECIGGYLSIMGAAPPAGFTFDEMANRAVPKEEYDASGNPYEQTESRGTPARHHQSDRRLAGLCATTHRNARSGKHHARYSSRWCGHHPGAKRQNNVAAVPVRCGKRPCL